MSKAPKLKVTDLKGRAGIWPMTKSEYLAMGHLAQARQELDGQMKEVFTEAAKRCGIALDAQVEVDLANRLWKLREPPKALSPVLVPPSNGRNGAAARA